MARLAHPNVVTVHDVGLVDDPVALPGHEVFVAMELIEGETLASWIARTDGDTDWSRIRDVLVDAAQGLAAAHAAGLVHRDFKPTNVLLGRDGRARVLDFGLARPIGTRPTGERTPGAGGGGLAVEGEVPTITPPGALLGTPPYMSPEQIAGGDVGPASDQFSFCVTMFEALYGYRPFQGPDTASLLRTISTCDAPSRPSHSRVPLWLHRVVLRGLRRDPSERYPSMADLVVAATADRRSKRRQRLGLLLATVLSAGGAAVASWALQPEPTAAEREQVDDWEREARAAAAEGRFVYPSAADDASRTAYQVLLDLDRAPGAAGELGHARALALRDEFADKLIALGDSYQGVQGGESFAADYYAAALVFRPDDPHARAQTTLTPGELATLRGRAVDGDFGRGELLAGQILAVLAADDDDERRKRATAVLADEHLAPTTAQRLQALVGPTSAPPAESVPRNTGPHTGVAASPGEDPPAPAESDPSSQTVIASEPPAAGSLAEAKALHTRARAALSAGDDDEAERLYHRALKAQRRYAPALAGLSQLYFDRAAYHKAVEYGELAVARSPRSGRYRIGLGDAYVKVLAYEDARRQYEKARDLGDARASKRLQLLQSRLGQSP